MTSAGERKFRIRFEKKTAKSGDGGLIRGDWAPQFSRWAKVQLLRGGESVQAARLEGNQPALIIVQDDSDTRLITADWRAVQTLRDGTERPYGIKTAGDMEGDRKHITILAVAGDPDGS